MKDFDETEAIEFIRNNVDGIQDCDNDDLVLVMDTMFEYDEMVGEEATDEQLAPESIAAYVIKQLKRDDEFDISFDAILPIVRAELAYEDYIWNNEE
ncbi:MAG: hypothetical protein J6S96_01045 [Muribaculaceae bacterium]|nr:hypothetical protein [Muribaculaceae bacterium]